MSEKSVSGEKVLDQPQRRKFTPEYKLRILQEIDSRKDEGRCVVGEVLRREGLYASQVVAWHNTLEEVIARGLPERKRGRKKDPALANKQENDKLQRQILRLKEELVDGLSDDRTPKSEPHTIARAILSLKLIEVVAHQFVERRGLGVAAAVELRVCSGLSG